MQNFMLQDLWGSLAAVVIYPLFVLLPGYALAWIFDLCAFRRRTQPFRLCLSLCLSIAVCPLIVYLVERFGSRNAVWAVFALMWMVAGFAILRGGRTLLSALPGWAIWAVVIWTAIAILSLIDLQFGQRDYYPITALDFSVRTSFTQAIANTIPPHNPFYIEGQFAPVRYHYFFMILCGMVERAGFGVVSPRHAWIGGVVWCGVGLMALVALSLRTVFYRGPETFRRRTIIGIVLLGATGLDILPAILGWGLHANGMEQAVLPSIDWWNLRAQICGFVSTALWEAHYLAGVIACVTAFLILWEGSREPEWGARIRHAMLAGVAVASALGISIYITLIFGAFLAVWTLFAAARKWWPEAICYVMAGAAALLCAAPYLLDLRQPAGAAAASAPALEFQVRTFSVDAMLESVGVHDGLPMSLANLALLPLNYFLELGFFFAAGRMWWTRRKRPLDRAELAMALMLAASLLICTFVRSSVISNNDLGWRGILVAQFVLLLWAVDIASGALGAIPSDLRKVLAVLLVLGFAGTAYDVVILRFYPVLADRGTVGKLGWMSQDRNLGARNFAEREAYEWIDINTPPRATVQFSPHVMLQETPAFLYIHRQFVAGSEDCLTTFGGDSSKCPAMQTTLDTIYPPHGGFAPPSIGDFCRTFPADIVIAKDADAVWKNAESWVWKETPVFANGYVRLFSCRGLR